MSLSGRPVPISSEPNSGYPRATVTNDGTILATYRWSAAPEAKIVTKMSKDNGVTWSDPVDVTSCDTAKGGLNNSFLLQTSSGAILCAYLLRLVDNNGHLKQIDLNVSQSDDGGHSWHKIGAIVSEKPGKGIQGEWEPFLHEGPEGALQAYYSHELAPKDQDIVYRTSGDGGKTWSHDFVTVAGAGDTTARPGMPQVLNVAGGGTELLMVYEYEDNGGRFSIWAKTSSDGGKTWVKPHAIYVPTKGNTGGPGLTRAGNRLVVSFMTNEEHADKPYPQAADMKIITSEDGGVTWSKPLLVIEQAGWGGVTAVKGGVVVVGATHDGPVVMQKVLF